MARLEDIQNQIEKLQKQAKEIKAREFDKVVADIRRQMEAFGISLNDLRQPSGRTRKAAPSAGKGSRSVPGAKARRTLPVKYRGPNGETWSGRGLPPRWMTSLLAEGKTRESFLVSD